MTPFNKYSDIYSLFSFRQLNKRLKEDPKMGNNNSTGNSDMAENADFISFRQVELDVRSTSSHSVQTQTVHFISDITRDDTDITR